MELEMLRDQLLSSVHSLVEYTDISSPETAAPPVHYSERNA